MKTAIDPEGLVECQTNNFCLQMNGNKNPFKCTNQENKNK
uniref:Uncharacterized protein n=1 Tax=Rhizophora mucronata TaxID=61149 RepID=A0A2P2QI38_RHIMU